MALGIVLLDDNSFQQFDRSAWHTVKDCIHMALAYKRAPKYIYAK